jgi:hypothetical protein
MSAHDPVSDRCAVTASHPRSHNVAPQLRTEDRNPLSHQRGIFRVALQDPPMWVSALLGLDPSRARTRTQAPARAAARRAVGRACVVRRGSVRQSTLVRSGAGETEGPHGQEGTAQSGDETRLGSGAADAPRGQGRLDIGTVIVRVPDGDLGEVPDPAVPGGQVAGGQAARHAILRRCSRSRRRSTGPAPPRCRPQRLRDPAQLLPRRSPYRPGLAAGRRWQVCWERCQERGNASSRY